VVRREGRCLFRRAHGAAEHDQQQSHRAGHEPILTANAGDLPAGPHLQCRTHSEATAWNNLGSALRFDEAIAVYTQDLEICRETGRPARRRPDTGQPRPRIDGGTAVRAGAAGVGTGCHGVGRNHRMNRSSGSERSRAPCTDATRNPLSPSSISVSRSRGWRNNLMAQDQQLHVLGCRRTTKQHQPAHKPIEDQIQQAQRHSPRSCLTFEYPDRRRSRRRPTSGTRQAVAERDQQPDCQADPDHDQHDRSPSNRPIGQDRVPPRIPVRNHRPCEGTAGAERDDDAEGGGSAGGEAARLSGTGMVTL
jgi:hypothetical protein